MHALQIQNVKRNVVKKASVSELNQEIVHPLETHNEIEQSQMGNNNEVNDNDNGTNDNGTSINDLQINDNVNNNNLE
jgi:vacuolar-type H+-ATPase subunit I/STV1